MPDEIRLANWKDRLLYFLGRRSAFHIEGASMSPTLKDGDVVLIDKHATVDIGGVVLAQHPYKTSVKIVKRVAAREQNGDLILAGDDPAESTDSRAFGAVSIQSVIGKVTCRLK